MTLLATGVKFLKNPDAIHYLEIICYQGNGWLKHISLLLAVSGSVSVFTGIFRVCVIQLKTSQETLMVNKLFSIMISFSLLCLRTDQVYPFMRISSQNPAPPPEI